MTKEEVVGVVGRLFVRSQLMLVLADHVIGNVVMFEPTDEWIAGVRRRVKQEIQLGELPECRLRVAKIALDIWFECRTIVEAQRFGHNDGVLRIGMRQRVLRDRDEGKLSPEETAAELKKLDSFHLLGVGRRQINQAITLQDESLFKAGIARRYIEGLRNEDPSTFEGSAYTDRKRSASRASRLKNAKRGPESPKS